MLCCAPSLLPTLNDPHFKKRRISERRRFYDSVISYTGNMDHTIKVSHVAFADVDTFLALFAGFPTESFKPFDVRPLLLFLLVPFCNCRGSFFSSPPPLPLS